MCGICGILNGDGQPAPRAALAAMTRAIAHRGPDSDGFYYDDAAGIGLGFRRLAIIDLTTGDQPIFSEDRQTVTVFNGEIYNYQILRRELQAQGHQFSSQTDTEVLVHGYESWGLGLLERLKGMYAFALWDSVQSRLLLVRDRLGEKPLYYAQWGQTLVFGSEVKALLQHPAAQRRLNHTVLAEYLTLGYVIPPNTLFEGIHKLPPGAFVSLTPDGPLQPQQYWQPRTAGTDSQSQADLIPQLRQKVQQSVEERLMSDVPLGTFLSGGVDSSAVTAFTGQATGQPVQAFTVGFDFAAGSQGDQKFNVDLHYARQAAQALGCHSHEIVLGHADVLAEVLPQLVYALDEPLSETAIMQTIFVCALARAQGVPVLLSGDGADEIFGGYPFFQQATRVELYQRLPSIIRHALKPIIGRLPWAGLQKLASKAALNSRAEQFLSWESHHRQPAALMLDSSCAQAGIAGLQGRLNDLLSPLQSPHLADHSAYAKLCLWLAEDSNMRVDKMAMWMSIEPRAPFQDHELVDLGLSIPLAYKLPNGGKGILKSALAEVLPPAILNRPKWGFNPPMSDWLRGPLKPLLTEYLSADRLQANGLQAAPIQQMLTDHWERKGYYLNELWSLLMLQLWSALYIHQDLPVPTRWTPADFVASADIRPHSRQ
jgi:asparagine synthase (glutamine-hydrolysing)